MIRLSYLNRKNIRKIRPLIFNENVREICSSHMPHQSPEVAMVLILQPHAKYQIKNTLPCVVISPTFDFTMLFGHVIFHDMIMGKV